MEPLIILVKPHQVSSLDPHTYHVVVLVVVLVDANDDAPIFSWGLHTRIHSLIVNQCFVVIVESTDARCDVVVAVLIVSILR